MPSAVTPEYCKQYRGEQRSQQDKDPDGNTGNDANITGTYIGVGNGTVDTGYTQHDTDEDWDYAGTNTVDTISHALDTLPDGNENQKAH